MRITKNERGLTVDIPEDVASTLGLSEGDEVQLRRASSSDLISDDQRAAARTVVRSFRGRMPAAYKFDRDEANARG